jgi:hypothetical protein
MTQLRSLSECLLCYRRFCSAFLSPSIYNPRLRIYQAMSAVELAAEVHIFRRLEVGHYQGVPALSTVILTKFLIAVSAPLRAGTYSHLRPIHYSLINSPFDAVNADTDSAVELNTRQSRCARNVEETQCSVPRKKQVPGNSRRKFLDQQEQRTIIHDVSGKQTVVIQRRVQINALYSQYFHPGRSQNTFFCNPILFAVCTSAFSKSCINEYSGM